jgi:hypothetical protein
VNAAPTTKENTMHTLRIIGSTALLLSLGTAPAVADPPANQACLGDDASTAAHALVGGGSSLGEVVSATATTRPRAIGDEVQAHLAGEIPDEVFPNTCND